MGESVTIRSTMLLRLRSAALVGATIALGISWSFSLLHVRTQLYPLLWAAAMPLLALYYVSGAPRTSWRHLPAAALSVYAVVLWRISSGYGLLGGIAVALGVASSLVVFWFCSSWNGIHRQTASAPSVARIGPAKRRKASGRRRRPA